MKLSDNQEAFVGLLRAGLWADAGFTESWSLGVTEAVDWGEVYRLAAEQSVLGLVLAGIERYKNLNFDLHLDQKQLLQWIGEVQMIEQQNVAMNKFVGQLIERLRKENIYALLVKGQGIAQCYEKPMWRASGDVDLLLDAGNYEKAKVYCDSTFESSANETAKNKERLHQDYQIGDWIVELHGTMHADLSRRMDRVIDQVQEDTFLEKQVRKWKNGDADVALPSPDNDVIFVFTHILQHLFLEGIGLRQICDWCRLLWTYRDSLNHGLLESRIRKMGLMSEWQVFGDLAVEYLGMPAEAMPFCDVRGKMYDVRARRLMDFIMKVGNFGHNRDVEWSDPFKRRSTLIWHRITDTIRLSLVFPIDAPKFLMKYVGDGVRNIVWGR